MADMDKIIEKIQHLLDKTTTNGASEAEAKQALLLAQKLMAKYNIEQGALPSGEKITYNLEMCKVKLDPRSKRMSVIIADSFGCKAIITYGRIHFFGHSVNAISAKSALEFAYKVMEQGMRKVCREHGLSSARAGASLIYNAYASGFLHGLKEALDAQTVALAVVVPEDVKAAFAEKFPVLKESKATMKMDVNQVDAFFAGKTDGKSVMNRRSIS